MHQRELQRANQTLTSLMATMINIGEVDSEIDGIREPISTVDETHGETGGPFTMNSNFYSFGAEDSTLAGQQYDSTQSDGIPASDSRMSDWTTDLSSIANEIRRVDESVVSALYKVLARWSTVVLAPDLFVAFLPSTGQKESPKEGNPNLSPSSSTSFCLIRTSRSADFVVNVQLGFFAVSPELRRATLDTLKWCIGQAHVSVPDILQVRLPKDVTAGTASDQGADLNAFGGPFMTQQERMEQSGMMILNNATGINAGSGHTTPAAAPTFEPSLAPVQPKLDTQQRVPSFRTIPRTVKPFGFPSTPIASILLGPHLQNEAQLVKVGLDNNDRADSSEYSAQSNGSNGLFDSAISAANKMLDLASSQPQDENAFDKGKDRETSSQSTASNLRTMVKSNKNLSLRLLRSYMRHHAWTWKLSSSESTATAMRLIRLLRIQEGFVLVSSSSNTASWLREVPLSQPGLNGENKAMTCNIQFGVTRNIESSTLETELWMEPHYGFYSLDEKSQESVKLESSLLFRSLCSWLHSCDLHVISAIATFDAICDVDFYSGDGEDTGGALLAGLSLGLSSDFRCDPDFSYEHDSLSRYRERALYHTSNEYKDTFRRRPSLGTTFCHLWFTRMLP